MTKYNQFVSMALSHKFHKYYRDAAHDLMGNVIAEINDPCHNELRMVASGGWTVTVPCDAPTAGKYLWMSLLVNNYHMRDMIVESGVQCSLTMEMFVYLSFNKSLDVPIILYFLSPQVLTEPTGQYLKHYLILMCGYASQEDYVIAWNPFKKIELIEKRRSKLDPDIMTDEANIGGVPPPRELPEEPWEPNNKNLPATVVRGLKKCLSQEYLCSRHNYEGNYGIVQVGNCHELCYQMIAELCSWQLGDTICCANAKSSLHLAKKDDNEAWCEKKVPENPIELIVVDHYEKKNFRDIQFIPTLTISLDPERDGDIVVIDGDEIPEFIISRNSNRVSRLIISTTNYRNLHLIDANFTWFFQVVSNHMSFNHLTPDEEEHYRFSIKVNRITNM